jgi:peptidylprolyl isomerase
MFYMKNFISTLIIVVSLNVGVSAQTLGSETILIETKYGKMRLKLYEETPQHKANFIKLVKEHFFDSLLFHRVINNFMIQGGDQLSKYAHPGDSLGHGEIGYTVPAEINRKLIHKRGTLCAARESDAINPNFESSASQFYIVMGKKQTIEDLHKNEDRINRARYLNYARTFIESDSGKFYKRVFNRLRTEGNSDSARIINNKIDNSIREVYHKNPEYKFNEHELKLYQKQGGTPHLDGTYTVFGEVIDGLDVIEKIAAVKTDKRDRPLEDIRMRIRIIE